MGTNLAIDLHRGRGTCTTRAIAGGDSEGKVFRRSTGETNRRLIGGAGESPCRLAPAITCESRGSTQIDGLANTNLSISRRDVERRKCIDLNTHCCGRGAVSRDGCNCVNTRKRSVSGYKGWVLGRAAKVTTCRPIPRETTPSTGTEIDVLPHTHSCLVGTGIRC